MPEGTHRNQPRAELSRVCLERRRAFRWLLLPAAQWVTASAWADASRIASARLWPAQEYTRVIFEAAAPIEHQLVVLRDPDRLVLDLARIERSRELEELAARVQPSDPYIAAIRIGQPVAGIPARRARPQGRDPSTGVRARAGVRVRASARRSICIRSLPSIR